MRRAKNDGRPVDYRYNQRLGMLRRRLRSTHITPVTIINTLPFRLAVNSVIPALQQGVTACPMDKEYSYFTWMDPVIEVSVQEGQKIPLDYNPLMMAEEYLREYRTIGGVLLFEGTVEEFAEEISHPQSATRKAFEEADAQGLEWQLTRVRQANDYWNTPDHRMASNITELHRACASRCMLRGRLGNTKPEWMDITRAVQEVNPICPACSSPQAGADPARCKVCMHVINPAKAFVIGDIDEKNIALERLTRAQVEEMGISDFVAETIDEKPDRLRRGEEKPLSRFEYRKQAEERAAYAQIAAQQQQGQQPQG
jgi:hypothetical protein